MLRRAWKVRQRLGERKYWRRDEWGVPINQEDMAVSHAARFILPADPWLGVWGVGGTTWARPAPAPSLIKAFCYAAGDTARV